MKLNLLNKCSLVVLVVMRGFALPLTTDQPVDLVYPHLDSANSRWFFFDSASRPFGMVNLSPDTELGGAWGSGYRYHSEKIKGLSHVHAWQLSALSVMPIASTEPVAKIKNDYYSGFSHETEEVAAGYHKLTLDRYGIDVELTATDRVGFHRYTYSKGSNQQILFQLGGKMGPTKFGHGEAWRKGSNALSGYVTNEPTRRRPRSTKVYFYAEFNRPIETSEGWSEGKRPFSGPGISGREAGLVLDLEGGGVEVLMKVGISYVSAGNAKANVQAELPGWDFDAVVSDARGQWNEWLSKIKVEGGTRQQQRRFYTDLWHALQGRRIISDANGEYIDQTGSVARTRQLPLDEDGRPQFNHYNSDSFWGAQWTINTLWGLVYPEVMEEFVLSLMQYYQDGGLIPRGPSGGNYTYVMTGASATPFIVSAIQKGIVTNDLENIYAALMKNHMPGGIMAKAGYEHSTNVGGGLNHYLEKGYVPYPLPEGKFGYHQDGASLTMEYAYQDWTLAQLAKKLGHDEEYRTFMKRSENYKNVFNQDIGWMCPKDVRGRWKKNFDPYVYEKGFNESNGAQSTWFVPHDLVGLAELMGGKEKAVQKLNAQFEAAQQFGFTSGSSHDRERHPELRRISINYGNQPSMQTAQIFSQLGRPDLSQYWTRKVVDAAFSGLSPTTGFNGDEDQGLMGSLSVLMKIGLFQMTGGTEGNPVYQIGSPIFDKITIQLNPDYYVGKTFVIEAMNNSEENVYIRRPTLNDRAVPSYLLSHDELTRGGHLVLEMTAEAE